MKITPEQKPFVDKIAAVLLPWIEEIQGEKFAAMDARMQAEQVVDAIWEDITNIPTIWKLS